jgi:hypothetical protein
VQQGMAYVVVTTVEPQPSASAFTLEVTQSGALIHGRKATTSCGLDVGEAPSPLEVTPTAILAPYVPFLVPLSTFGDGCTASYEPIVGVCGRQYGVTYGYGTSTGTPVCEGGAPQGRCVRRLDVARRVCSGSALAKTAALVEADPHETSFPVLESERQPRDLALEETLAVEDDSSSVVAKQTICIPDWTPLSRNSPFEDVGIRLVTDRGQVPPGTTARLTLDVTPFNSVNGEYVENVVITLQLPKQTKLSSVGSVPGMQVSQQKRTLTLRFARVGPVTARLPIRVPLDVQIKSKATGKVLPFTATVVSRYQDVRTGNNFAGLALRIAR